MPLKIGDQVYYDEGRMGYPNNRACWMFVHELPGDGTVVLKIDNTVYMRADDCERLFDVLPAEHTQKTTPENTPLTPTCNRSISPAVNPCEQHEVNEGNVRRKCRMGRQPNDPRLLAQKGQFVPLSPARHASPVMKDILKQMQEQRVSVTELARRLKLDRGTVSRWRHGRSEPSIMTAEEIAAALGCRIVVEVIT